MNRIENETSVTRVCLPIGGCFVLCLAPLQYSEGPRRGWGAAPRAPPPPPLWGLWGVAAGTGGGPLRPLLWDTGPSAEGPGGEGDQLGWVHIEILNKAPTYYTKVATNINNR